MSGGLRALARPRLAVRCSSDGEVAVFTPKGKKLIFLALPLPPTLEIVAPQYQTRGSAPLPCLPCLHKIACPENGDIWQG